MAPSITQAPDWAAITAALAVAFDPKDVEFLPLTTEIGSDGKGLVAAYIDARAVQERLDAVVPGAWSFDWQPLHTNAQGQVVTAKGTITIHGVSRSDIGDGTGSEASKSSISDCEKRAGVQWGIARYIYALPRLRAKMDTWTDKAGKLHISGVNAAAAAELRRGLPKPGAPAARENAYQDETVAQPETATATDSSATTTLEAKVQHGQLPAQTAKTKAAVAAELQQRWNAAHARALKLGMSEPIWRAAVREKYPTVTQMEAALDAYAKQQEAAEAAPEPVELSLDEPITWQSLRGRFQRAGACASDADWTKIMEQTGASFEDAVVLLKRYENHELELIGAGSGLN
jgi:hypothetical protein